MAGRGLFGYFALEALGEQGDDGFVVFAAGPAQRHDLVLDLAVLENGEHH